MISKIKNYIKKKKSVECPFCLATFSKKDRLYRCDSPPQVCQPVVDSVYEDYWGEQGVSEQGKVFDLNWKGPLRLFRFFTRTRSPECPACSKKTQQRACPVCHANLPSFLGNVPVYRILFVAPEGAGARTFLHALTQRMADTLAHDLHTRFRMEHGFWVMEESVHLKKSLALFFEHVPLSQVDVALKHLSHRIKGAQGVLIFMDAEMFFDADRQFEAQDMRQFLESFLGDSLMGKEKPRGVPLGMVLNKADTIMSFLPRRSFLFENPTHDCGYDKVDGARVSMELKGLLLPQLGMNVFNLMRRAYQHVRFFSTASEIAHDPFTNVPAASATLRLEDPLRWLLWRWHLISSYEAKDEEPMLLVKTDSFMPVEEEEWEEAGFPEVEELREGLLPPSEDPLNDRRG